MDVPETLLGLVKHYSPTHQEQGAVAWLVQRMKALGYTRAHSDAVGNAVGEMGQGPKQIILMGHIDTVPGEIQVRQEGDDLYGRGSVDAKGALAAFVDAVAAVGAVPGHQLLVVGAVEEEGDSRGAWYTSRQHHPAFCIIGEPSHWERVAIGYRGSLWFEYAARRALSHTASDNESACEAAAKFWDRLKAHCAAYNVEHPRIFEQLSCTLRAMSSRNDGFEETASLRIGMRLPLSIPIEQWWVTLDEMRGDDEVFTVGTPVPAYRTDKNTPLVRAFLAAIRAQGGSPGFVLKSGTADMNAVGPVWNCPILAYGPGDSTLDHTPHEHLPLSEYARAVAVLTHVLRTLTQA